MDDKDRKKVEDKARLVVAAEAAKTILEMFDNSQLNMWLSKEARRDLDRLAQEAPKPVKPMYYLD